MHESIGRYHPFDGDGMLHQIAFHDGHASYRNRFVRTDGFLAEQEAAESLWTGMLGAPEQSKREDGWGARGRMKDASSTDVVVHNGQALTSFWQCGDLYALDPRTLEQQGKAHLGARASRRPPGSPRTPRSTSAPASCSCSATARSGRTCTSASSAPTASWCGRSTSSCPGLGCPHDMAFTEQYAILNDLPLFWDPDLLAQGVHLPRFFPDLPSRFAIVRRDGTGDVRWFEADPTYVLHWINAYEDGDEVVLDGFFQHDPSPPKREGGPAHMASVYRYLDLEQLQARPHRWRFNLVTGQTKEEPLSDRIMEFGMVNGADRRPAAPLLVQRHRRTRLVPLRRPREARPAHRPRGALRLRRRRVRQRDAVRAAGRRRPPRTTATSSPSPPTWDATCSECLVFDATDLTAGPIARVRLPERISSGTHSCWVPSSALAT